MAVRPSSCSSSTMVQRTHRDRSGSDSRDEDLVPRRIRLRQLHGDHPARSEVFLSSQRDAALLMLPGHRAAFPGSAARAFAHWSIS